MAALIPALTSVDFKAAGDWSSECTCALLCAADVAFTGRRVSLEGSTGYSYGGRRAGIECLPNVGPYCKARQAN